MSTERIYPDSLTPIQKSCVEKAYYYATDPKYDSWEIGPWDVDDLMTKDEKDALIELAIWNYRKIYKPIENKVFNKRIRTVFGYDFDSLAQMSGKKQTDNLISLCSPNPDIEFLISKKANVIIFWQNLFINFKEYDNISSFYPSDRTDSISVGNNQISSLDYLYHLNNYLFNEANVSRTWLINNDKYFMSHLLIQYGYDGDNEINKMVLKKNRDNDVEIIDMPVAAFHVYPDGKVKILDGLLKSAAELSTADCADYFEWATSIVDRFNASAFYKEAPSDDYDRSNPLEVEYHRYSQKIHNLTTSQRREIIAHVVNYMLPVYGKYIDGNMSYGTQSLDYGDLRIIDCFWNAITFDHELIAEIEKNNYYGLPNLESLISSMKNFKPFYNEETNEFEPWEYVPMRYRHE
ncbi:MAG: hypothetical protein U0K66_11040 [Paludibacteraceae bacterium]|nr:hypothetical protein [Paludibacteraceae bacterium]